MKQKSLINTLIVISICSFFPEITIAENTKNATKGAYKWTDSDGKVYYSNSVPPEANQNEIKSISKSGNLKKHSDAQKTQEEIEKEKIEKEKEAIAAKQEKELNRKLKILQERYSSKEQFDEIIEKINKDWEERLSPIKERRQNLLTSLTESKKNQNTERSQSLTMELEKTDIYINALQQQYNFELQKIIDDKKMWLEHLQKN